jgi:hypothetical protein
MNGSHFWVSVYDVIALIGVGLSLYVMQKTEHDRINKVAPEWLKQVRRGSFIGMALLLCNSIINDAGWFSLVLIVCSGIFALLINAIALMLRVPPNNRYGVSSHSGLSFRQWWPVRHMMAMFRNIGRQHK